MPLCSFVIREADRLAYSEPNKSARMSTVTSSLDKVVEDLSRCKASESVIWFAFFKGGFLTKGYGIVTESTEETLKFETSSAHYFVMWGMFKPTEIEYLRAFDIDAMYLPGGAYPKAGWWRIATPENGVIHFGELGVPPTLN
jgi:hypothetical protein